MYITPNRSQRNESDDLNALFVEYQSAQMGVEMFPLTDLVPVTETVERTEPDGSTQTVRETHYYYGGGLSSHLGFFLLYSFLLPPPMLYYPAYAGRGFAGRGVAQGRSAAPGGRPTARTTRPVHVPRCSAAEAWGGSAASDAAGPRALGAPRFAAAAGVSPDWARAVWPRRSGSFGRGRGFSL